MKLMSLFARKVPGFECADWSEPGFPYAHSTDRKAKGTYAELPINKVERASVKGKVFFVFKDEKAGVS